MERSVQCKQIYPRLRYLMGMGRSIHGKVKSVQFRFVKRHTVSNVIPDTYQVCNTNTIDSNMTLHILSGELPKNVDGNLYICQCLGTPGAFMVGDTNLVKMNFTKERVTLKNRLMWNPVAIARMALRETKYRFDYFGLMFLSPGVGMFSYTEGMYLLPDGRLGITSDVDRPWIVDREQLRVETPLGSREEWLPMMSGSAAEIMGSLFAGYSNSHAVYTDTETNELFLVNYQYEAVNKEHPCQLMKWDGKNRLEKWYVVDENGVNIKIVQSIHELIFTRDYILLADTSFVAGMEMLTPWQNAPLPNKDTIVYIVDRRQMLEGVEKVPSKKVTIKEACIHLIAEYENPNDCITVYMLHTPATNTAEIMKDYDTDLDGVLFPKHLVGYGTLPVLDLSSVGKHVINMRQGIAENSWYITDEQYCWGPYMYTYMGRQTCKFQEQDLYIMFKGFSKEMLPKRIYHAYKDVENRRCPLDTMVGGKGLQCNNSIARINKERFEIVDAYTFPDKVLLYTISCLESTTPNHAGYVIAGVVQDVCENEQSSGHEYWLFQADALEQGPVCTLGNTQLNNSVLFHTVYINSQLEKELDQKKITYKVPIQRDYPKEEVEVWGLEMVKAFEEFIYPYNQKEQTVQREKAEKTLREFATKRIPLHAGSEHLIGEVTVNDAPKKAQKMIEEANRMFATTGWKVESKQKGLLVESKPVSGVLASANICVVRASGVVEAEAKEFFAYMVSPKGYAVIDPVSDPDDHEKEPLQVYEWRENCRLEAAVATTKISGMKPADFVVLNAIDSDEMMFASKSILHDRMPGGSKYSRAGSPINGRERALNTFVIKVVPIDQRSCQVLCINYADMMGNTSSRLNNFINKKAFFKPLYSRMHKAAREI
ncbi:MAG: carotenoid oxygenase family protein [Eubacteriales bacterium]